MSTPIPLHQLKTQTHLPAHEHAARRRRLEATALQEIPGSRPPRQPRPPLHKGRKTFDTRILSTPL